jgi:hypothetical protein
MWLPRYGGSDRSAAFKSNLCVLSRQAVAEVVDGLVPACSAAAWPARERTGASALRRISASLGSRRWGLG